MAAEVMTVRGNASQGYRISLPELCGTRAIYLAQHKDALRVLGFDATPHILGRHILGMLERNQERDAQSWLDWVAMPANRPGLDPLAGLWGQGLPRDRAAALLAAKALVALGPDAASVHTDLQRAYAQAVGDRRQQLAKLILERTPTAAAVDSMVTELYRTLPNDLAARYHYRRWAIATRRYSELETALSQSASSETTPLRRLVAWLRGGFSAEQELLRRVERAAKDDLDDYQSIVWHSLFEQTQNNDLPRYTARLLDKLREPRAGTNARAAWLVAAAYFAERDQIAEALAAFRQAQTAPDRPDNELNWFVTGLLAERLGDPTLASEAFTKAAQVPNESPDAPKVLAERHLKRLNDSAKP